MEKIIDGKEISRIMSEEHKEKLTDLRTRNIVPSLSIIIVGEDEWSKKYVELKKRKLIELGANVEITYLDEKVDSKTIIDTINNVNNDSSINGILVQLPLPSKFSEEEIISTIDPLKDVDCLTEINLQGVKEGKNKYLPAGVQAIIEIFERKEIDYLEKKIAIGGNTKLLAIPLYDYLKRVNNGVNLERSNVDEFSKLTKEAEIVVVDFAEPNVVTKETISSGVIIIDAGNNYHDGKLCGDVDFNGVIDMVNMITPVPGGLGPVLVSSLLENLIIAVELQK
jgi:methylenetetrahydrofolate dehydrogenase (NADP+)/methenyltetrahydrofolate cyclohydrolase